MTMDSIVLTFSHPQQVINGGPQDARLWEIAVLARCYKNNGKQYLLVLSRAILITTMD